MERKRLNWLKSLIGQSTRNSPSPFAHWLDGTLLEVEIGQVAVEYAVREDMANPMGMLHGGVISGILDDIIGTAVASLDKEQHYVSINLAVDFINASRVGDLVTARAEIVRNGRTVVYAKASLYNAKNVLLATCTSNLVQVPTRS